MPDNNTAAINETTAVLAITSLKSIAEQPAMLANLLFANTITNVNLSQQNAVANQQAMNELGISVVGKMVNKISDLGPLEARSAVDVLTDNALADEIASLKAVIQSFAASQAGAS